VSITQLAGVCLQRLTAVSEARLVVLLRPLFCIFYHLLIYVLSHVAGYVVLILIVYAEFINNSRIFCSLVLSVY